MNGRVSNIFKYSLWALVAAALLYFSFRKVAWADLKSGLAQCRWSYVALAMAAGALSQYVRAIRWRMLILPVDGGMDRISVFNATNICLISNLVVPRSGEFVRCGYVTANSAPGPDGHRKASYDKVLGTVVAERAWDIAMVALIAVVLVPLMWGQFKTLAGGGMLGSSDAWKKLIIIALVGLALLAALFFLLWKFRSGPGLPSKAWNVVLGIWDGLKSFLKLEKGWLFIVLTVIVWGLYLLESCGIIWAVRGGAPEMSSLGVGDALFLMFVGTLSSFIPVPGGFGAFHTLVAGALSAVYGVPFALGLVFATLSHESQTLVQILLGGISFIWESVKKRKGS